MPSGQNHEEYYLLHGYDDTSIEDITVKTDHYAINASLSESVPFPRLWKSLLIVSMVLVSHVFVFCIGFKFRQLTMEDGLSPYLKLKYSVSDVLWWNTEYSSENSSEAELNRLWDSTIPWESGIIALTNEEAEDIGLPDSQPFPWDSRKKKIFILNAHHLLHCVRNIYIFIHQYRTNQKQTIHYAHILHCLDSLRVETMCTADDTPRYVPLNSVHGFRPGDGQQRKCRDWGQVQAFVQAHDPCYQYLRPGDGAQSNLERFSFCPTDSEYLPKIRKYFGYDQEWTPWFPDGPREITW